MLGRASTLPLFAKRHTRSRAISSQSMSTRTQEVTSMTKETNVGFPNSIRIKWGDHDSLFFTSFINREDAYECVVGRGGAQKACMLVRGF